LFGTLPSEISRTFGHSCLHEASRNLIGGPVPYSRSELLNALHRPLY
jgi:hypothetical protein